MEVKVYVGNLSYNTTEDDLHTLFEKAGQVASVALITDRHTGRSKGFAFVEMSTQVEAEQAISMYNGFNLDDRELKVNMAKPREDRRGSGAGNRRSGFGNRNRRR
jgi:cold-inducible RNA-binding protein